ncbi:MAG: tetratricopeptide repeat protein, partial [Bryobacterales bacterium]|nr:tetratricopeptide repeat protein [Bryobacterales bacterium]
SYLYPWFNLGRAHAALGRWELARDCFQKANDIEPDYAPAKEAAALLEAQLKEAAADGVR